MGKEVTPTTTVELSADFGMGGAESQIWRDLWGFILSHPSVIEQFHSAALVAVEPLSASHSGP